MFNRLFKSWEGTSWGMSTGAANFLAGGLASNIYWFTALRESRLYAYRGSQEAVIDDSVG